jgi:hypothetical protein
MIEQLSDIRQPPMRGRDRNTPEGCERLRKTTERGR